MTERRRYTRHTKSFKERLVEEAAKSREAAERLPTGPERELLMRRVQQVETAAQIDDWLTSARSAAPAPKLLSQG